MTINQLESFVAAAELLNFTKAADRLYISQPALTKHLHDLEKELGCVLFIRTTRKVQLTESGMICLKYAKQILRDLSHMKDAVAKDLEERFMDLHIGYVTKTHERYIETGIQALHAAHPGIRVHIHKGNPPDLTEQLEKGSLDCAFLHLPSVENQKSIVYETLFAGGVIARIPGSHRLSTLQEISCRDLKGEKIVCGQTIAPACFLYMLDRFGDSSADVTFVEGITEESIALLSRGMQQISLTSELSEPMPGFINIPIREMKTGFDLVLARSISSDNPRVLELSKAIRGSH